MLVVERIRAAGAAACSLIVGTTSFPGTGEEPSSLDADLGLAMPSWCGRGCSVTVSDRGGWIIGNLKSESVSEPGLDPGDSDGTPPPGVFGTVEAPEERPLDALLSGG